MSEGASRSVGDAEIKRRGTLLAALGVVLGGLGALQVSAADRMPRRPLVGAIRWDAWTEWDHYQKYLRPKEWHSRLPFFARETPEGSVVVRGDSQRIMDREIRYARAAGIDYWAWVWYDPKGDTATQCHMNDCLNLYLSNAHKPEVHYCLIGTEYWATRHWPDTVAELVTHFRRPVYQKVFGDRPLFYWFDSQNVVPHFVSPQAACDALSLLRQKTVEAGLGSPYVVGLCFWPDKGARAVEDVGFDARGAYCNPAGADGKEYPYSELAARNRWFWEESRKYDKELVLPMNVGWDPRPRIETLEGQNPSWHTQATPQELADHLKSALSWTRQNRSLCRADTVLVYAWNEFDEGGWLCATLDEGPARLRAIGNMLRAWRE